MELRDFVALGGRAPGLRLLVIGGHAVAAHGHTRPTFDVDFLIPRSDRAEWMQRAGEAALKVFSETDNFIQFDQPNGADSLDLMLVADATFEEFWSGSEAKQMGGVEVRVPSLWHLLALKLHALKHSSPERTSKDAEDVEMLIRRNNVALDQPAVRSLFLKYGTAELHDTFTRLLRHP